MARTHDSYPNESTVMHNLQIENKHSRLDISLSLPWRIFHARDRQFYTTSRTCPQMAPPSETPANNSWCTFVKKKI